MTYDSDSLEEQGKLFSEISYQLAISPNAQWSSGFSNKTFPNRAKV
jgi:hypothetical protein